MDQAERRMVQKRYMLPLLDTARNQNLYFSIWIMKWLYVHIRQYIEENDIRIFI